MKHQHGELNLRSVVASERWWGVSWAGRCTTNGWDSRMLMAWLKDGGSFEAVRESALGYVKGGKCVRLRVLW